jgi:uncharacterized protein YebE (UPF0316 family)
MESQVIFSALFIVIARIVDVSLGTLRTFFIVQGRKKTAFCLAFIEVLIWVVVVSKVVQNLHEPVLMIAFAFGFALGTYIGVTLESWLAVGRQVVRIFSRESSDIAQALRELGHRVTSFEGQGQEGAVSLLFLEAKRKHVRKIVNAALQLDPKCFYIVDDIRTSSSLGFRMQAPTGWRAIRKRK